MCGLQKVPLDIIEPPLVYKCPRCKNTYQLGYEILEHEDDIVSSHEDESDIIELAGLQSSGVNSVGLLTKEGNELDFPSLDEQYENREGKIPVPDYFKDSVTTKVIDYKEEIEE